MNWFEEYRVCRYAYSYEAQASADDSRNKSITMGPLKGVYERYSGSNFGGKNERYTCWRVFSLWIFFPQLVPSPGIRAIKFVINMCQFS